MLTDAGSANGSYSRCIGGDVGSDQELVKDVEMPEWLGAPDF